MSKYEEKMQALKVLKSAIDCVNEATDAIDAFAEEYGLKPEKDRTVDLCELTEMVVGETGMKAQCVYDALTCAFDLIRDLGLTVTVEEEDEDDE